MSTCLCLSPCCFLVSLNGVFVFDRVRGGGGQASMCIDEMLILSYLILKFFTCAIQITNCVFRCFSFQQYGDIRTLYTACKHRGFVMISYYDIRAARTAMRALQNKHLRRRKLDIHFSIPKVSDQLQSSLIYHFIN